MAEYSGFFNAYLDAGGNYDRHYKSEDYCDNLAVVISNGVLRGVDDDLKVTSNGLNLTVGAGRGWIKGHYYYNSTPLELDPVTPPTGGARFDRVILRFNNNIEVRSVSVQYLQGTAAAEPVKPDITRTDEIFDLVLADIYITQNAGEVTVIDTRSDADVCGWVYSVDGDDSFFTTLDNSFNIWFENLRDTVATSTLEVEYRQLAVLTAATTTINITITQFNPDYPYRLAVYVNGSRAYEGTDFTVTGRSLTFTNTLNKGTKVLIALTVARDGSDILTIVDEVATLEDKVAALEQGIAYAEYNYICNGSTDNENISNIVTNFVNAGEDYRDLKINIYGTFGATDPVSGSGTVNDPYIWVRAGKGSESTRRCYLDFSNCSQIRFNCNTPSAYYIGFFGLNIYLLHANVIMNSETAFIYLTSTANNTRVYAENCRFWVNAKNGHIAKGGNFVNCRVSFTAYDGDGNAFNISSTGMLKITGGEYYSYAKSGRTANIVNVASDQTNAVVISYAMNAPTIARSGYVQTAAFNILTNSGFCSVTDTVTQLQVNASGQNVRGTLRVNKAGFI